MVKDFSTRLEVIAIVLIYCLASSFCKQQVPQPNAAMCTTKCSSGSERILSRKRRALTFPEGSSLQLVYDQTIPVVAAQLLFTVGVTCALAFELPSEPIYHITQKLRDNMYGIYTAEKKEEDATVAGASSNETDDDTSRVDYNYNRLNYIDNNKQNYYNSMNKHNYYYSGGNYYKPNYISDKSDNYGNKYSNKSSTFVKLITANQTKNVFTAAIKTFVDKFGKKVLSKKLKKFKGKKKLGNIFLRKHLRVYPVFGKRSVEDHLTDEEKFYMEHHRSSRFSLYEKIEGFLKGRGKDGKACVLRALCETAQKNQGKEKGPFLLEILRAVFSLPHQVAPYSKDSHQHFDDAHSELEANCADRYPECKDSIWSTEFRF